MLSALAIQTAGPARTDKGQGVRLQCALESVEVVDLLGLREALRPYQPLAWNKCEQARDAVRYLAVVEKLLRAIR